MSKENREFFSNDGRLRLDLEVPSDTSGSVKRFFITDVTLPRSILSDPPETPIHEAVRLGNMDVINALEFGSPFLHQSSKIGFRPLDEAIYLEASYDLVRALVLKGADMHARPEGLTYGVPSWVHSIRMVRLDLVHFFVSAMHCDPHEEIPAYGSAVKKSTPFLEACRVKPIREAPWYRILSMIQYLIEVSKQRGMPEGQLELALESAVNANREDLVEILLDSGADPNLDLKGETRTHLLLRACQKGNQHMVVSLLKRGAKVYDTEFVTRHYSPREFFYTFLLDELDNHPHGKSQELEKVAILVAQHEPFPQKWSSHPMLPIVSFTSFLNKWPMLQSVLLQWQRFPPAIYSDSMPWILEFNTRLVLIQNAGNHLRRIVLAQRFHRPIVPSLYDLCMLEALMAQTDLENLVPLDVFDAFQSYRGDRVLLASFTNLKAERRRTV